MRLSYLYYGNSHTGKTAPLYWDRPLYPSGVKESYQMQIIYI